MKVNVISGGKIKNYLFSWLFTYILFVIKTTTWTFKPIIKCVALNILR